MIAKQKAAFAVQTRPMLLPRLRGWPRSRMDTRTHMTGTQCYFHTSFFSEENAHSSLCPRVLALLFMNLCVLHSTAMLEESQDGMDSGTLSPASARQVTIQRHPTQGFGFVAGSQRPVIVRSVSAG